MFTLKYCQRKVLVTIPEQVYMDQRKIAAWLHFILNLAVTLSERQYKASSGVGTDSGYEYTTLYQVKWQ